jgi:hypothetical protein
MSTDRLLFPRGSRPITGLRRNTGLLFLIVTLSAARNARATEVVLDAPYTSYVSGHLVTGVAAGDVNGDGHVDLVSCNDETVASIFLGHGDGTLDPSGEIVVGTGGRYVALADLDLDGRLDLVIARSTALTVARGNGDGSFATPSSYATNGVNTNRIVQIADLDSDGRLDLVTNEGGNGTLWLFPGNGDGTFGARQALTPQAPFHFILADLNGDGRLDFLRTFSGPLTVQLGDGNGAFGAPTDYPAGTLLGRAAVGDLNHDGKLDVTAAIAQGQSLENSVAVFLGDGAGGFGTAVHYPVQTNPRYAVVADLDGDGTLDVATVNLPLSNGGTLSMLRGRGDGTFDPSRDYPCGTDARWPAATDLDEDGKSDIAVPSRFGTSVLIYRANAEASFGSAVSIRIGKGPAAVTSGDLDGDGRPDLVTTFFSGDSLAVVLATGPGTFGAPTALAMGVSTGYLELGDLNGDGKLDLVSSPREDVADASVSVRIGLGNGSFLPPVTWAAGPTTPAFIEIEDLNEDGRPDLLVSNFGDIAVPDTGHTVSVLLGNGDGTFAAPMSFETGLRPYGLDVADLNADGHDDVAVANRLSQSISILLGNGDGTFGPRTDYPAGSFIYRVAVADVNEDGAPDVVYDGGILLGTGAGSFSLSPFTFSLYLAGLEDLDVDGHMDLMVLDFYSNAMRIARGSGNGVFATPPFDFGLGSSIGYPAFDDFNGDGLLDVVTANGFLNDLAVVFNRTPGLVSVPVTPIVRPGALRVLPNPVRGGDLVVEYASATRAPARIELFDLAGRRIVAREIAAGEPGTHRLPVMDRGRLEAGIYFLRLHHAGRTSTARAIVLD